MKILPCLLLSILFLACTVPASQAQKPDKKLDNKGMKSVFGDRMGASNGKRTSMKVPGKGQ